MIYREAAMHDIKPIMKVRFSVRENVLNNPDLVTEADCVDYIFNRGKGWICEVDGAVVGFSIVDLVDKNVWALFLDPDFEKRGIGRQLHDLMLDWYFSQTGDTLWLGTAPGTRAEGFYRKAGWTAVGMHGNEIKFEMPAQSWRNQNLKITS
jgi:GNAT superfamily N-acetyltransferase